MLNDGDVVRVYVSDSVAVGVGGGVCERVFDIEIDADGVGGGEIVAVGDGYVAVNVDVAAATQVRPCNCCS